MCMSFGFSIPLVPFISNAKVLPSVFFNAISGLIACRTVVVMATLLARVE